MRQKQHRRILALILLVALALSFLWCIVDNVLTGAAVAKTGAATPVTAVTITRGVLWLVGHGVHGAAVIVLPTLLWQHSQAKGRVHAV